MIQIWTRHCDVCGRVARVVRSITARAPRSVYCLECDYEHPRIDLRGRYAYADDLYARPKSFWVRTVR